jgi:hypothetical protein
MDKHLRRGNTVQPLRTKLAAIKNAFSEAYSSINRRLLHKSEIMVIINTKRLEMHHSTEEKVLLVLVVAVCLILYVFMLFATTNTVTSVSAVDADGIGVYWDSDCSDRVSSIDWETLTPGSVKSVVVYVRNENEEPIYLNMSTANWNPSNASQYITLRWDYSEQRMNPSEALQIRLSLSVSRYIEGISSFSFDILITGSTSLPLNTPPKASHLAISPSLPYATDDLVGSYIYYDADGDPEYGSEIRWYKDSVLQSAYNDQLRVFASAAFEGDVWYFTVRPKDGTDLGDLAESNKVTVQSLPNCTLAIYSSPNGVTFKVDGVSHSTPWSGIYDEGTSVGLEMPETHVVDEARYYWDRWSDEVTSRSRTVTMYTDITLTAYFSAQPVARFTCSPAVPSVGEEITFDASSSLDLDEDIVSYRWDFYDGNISLATDSTTVHIYKFPGRFNVTLTVIDSKGVNCSYSQTVWVRMPTSVSISTSCPPTFVGFTVNVSGTLRDVYKNALKNETVFLYYTFGGTGTWSPITSEITDNLGNYFATWIPPIIGNFQIKVEWGGNSTHFGTSNVTSLNMHTHISISLSSSTSYVGFKVEINGNFTCNGIGYPEAPILLSYSVTGGESWNDITLVNTSSDGGYFALWLPPATGSYFVEATWTGNPAYPGATATVNLAVIPFEEQNVFSVTSNSTVSALAFNSTSRELSFTVTGPSGTTGYANVYIAKTLVENIADVKVYLNGNQLNYTVTSLDDSWLLHFTYQHSTHKVTVTLGHVSAPFIETPLGKIIAIGIPIIAIVILIILYVLKRKRRSL